MLPMKTLSTRLGQQELYTSLRSRGSPWLKSHVLWADRQVLVLNKPPDVVCQMGDYGRKSSTGEATPLDPVFSDIKWWIPGAAPCSVHRLDKPTTGCLMIALNGTSAKALSRQFEQGHVKKTYLALVRGGKKSFDSESGQINAPLLYKDGRGEVNIDGKYAVTEWNLVASSNKAPISLVRLNLITGNKHQLRIHLAKCLKTPILGDEIYSKKVFSPSIDQATKIPENRLFLHASELSFYKYHDRGKRNRLGIRAPIPKDFQRICRDLGIALPYNGAGLAINDHVGNDEFPGMELWNPNHNDRRVEPIS